MNSKKAKSLPPFEPVTDAELRRYWNTCTPEGARRLVLEVVRYRHLIAEIDDLYEAVQKAWFRETHSHLFALIEFKRLMGRERFRVVFKPSVVLDRPYEPDRNRLRR